VIWWTAQDDFLTKRWTGGQQVDSDGQKLEKLSTAFFWLFQGIF